MDESNWDSDIRPLRDNDAIDNYRLLAIAISSTGGRTNTVNDFYANTIF